MCLAAERWTGTWVAWRWWDQVIIVLKGARVVAGIAEAVWEEEAETVGYMDNMEGEVGEGLKG